MTAEATTFALLRTCEEMLAIRAEWDALWARSYGDYFTGLSSCILSWETVHAPQGHALCVAVARSGGQLVGVLPMATHRKRLWTIATTLGPDAAEGCDILVGADAPAALADNLLRFFMKTSGADVLDLAYVRDGSALDAALARLDAFRVVAQATIMPCTRFGDAPDWDAYERSLARHTQREVGRKRRQFEKMGTVAFEMIEGPADTAIDWLLDEKAAWGRSVGKVGAWLFSPLYRTFLKRFAAASGGPSGERVLTFVLTLDGKPAAVKVLTIGPTLCTLIIAAYDNTLAKWSPGNILDEIWMRYVFDHARDAGGRRLDVNFGTGTEHYKLHWSRDFAWTSRTYKVAATRWGALPYRAKALAAHVRSVARRGRRPAATPAIGAAE